ncbi:MAG: hypothetical protein ACIAQF_06060 [Phycisphaerales bacterium JB065]
MQRCTLLNLTLGALLILLAAKAALACFWDRDTLAQEAAGLPGVVEVLLGRIDRWPPEYYAMRLERVTRQLESDPTNLALYDDAAVASDRLKRYDDAIEWMARKRTILDTLPPTSHERTEHEYRYLANLGTHHAHRWIASGGSATNLTDLERAIELIRAAIDLNPDAHFGREKVQLGFLESLLYTRTDGKDKLRIPIGVFVTERSTAEVTERSDASTGELPTDTDLAADASWYFVFNKGIGFLGSDIEITADEAVEGLIGLMTLGDAWSSIDVHESLALALMRHRQRIVTAHLAALRSVELHMDGGRSILHPTRDPESTLRFGESLVHIVSDAGDVEAYFDRSRPLVDQINADRMAFIQSRLADGKHPDTHADFWNGYKQPTIPGPPGAWDLEITEALIVGFGLLLFSPFGLLAYFRWRAGSYIVMATCLVLGLAIAGGLTSLALGFSRYLVPHVPGDEQRWHSYDTFRAAMQSSQP